MQKVLLFVMLAVVVLTAQAQQPGEDGIGDPYFPRLGNGGYDVQHYTIDLDVDVAANRIDGTVTIDLRATEDLSAFNLDFVGYDITALTVNGEDADFARTRTELTITPAQPLMTDETATIAVTYNGKPSGAGGFSSGWVRYRNGVFVASEPDGSQRWFPVNDHPLDKATYTFIITVPESFVVAANGVLKETIEEDGTITYVWSMDDVMASYLATVNISDFEVRTEEGPNGLPIRNYFPADQAEAGAKTFSQTADMIALFEETFGPYPFDVYGVVVADTFLPFALETQTISLFGSNVIDEENWSKTASAQEVIAHELAHQWFGNSLTPAGWKDLWLNEGFASYAQILWVEHTQGREAADNTLKSWYSVLVNPLQMLLSSAAPGNPPPNDLFNTAVYLRGGWTLHALRLEVGDEAFFDILRTYTDRYKYGNVTTADFIAVAEEVSGQELDELFDTWLFQRSMPDVPAMDLVAPKPKSSDQQDKDGS